MKMFDSLGHAFVVTQKKISSVKNVAYKSTDFFGVVQYV